MKTGRPGYHIPSADTVSRDVKKAFVQVRRRVANMLKVSVRSISSTFYSPTDIQSYDGALNFATDAWTSPNHKAYVAVTVHFEHEGAPISMLLDLVEVAKSHSGVNLAEAFVNILDEFGIEDKVSSHCIEVSVKLTLRVRFSALRVIMHLTTTAWWNISRNLSPIFPAQPIERDVSPTS